MPDLRGNLTLADVLLDLAQQPDRLLQLEDTLEKEEKVALLSEWYPDYFSAAGRRAFVEDNLQQIRLTVEADYEASPGHKIRITFVIITF
jgi:hypothetical protein